MIDPSPAERAARTWEDAVLAAALFAVDPAGVGGAVVRAGAGPARDAWMSYLQMVLAPGAPWRRIPCHIADERLLGGLDLGASLSSGRPVAQRGVLAECDGGVAILPMAERLEDATAARLAAAMDHGAVTLERDGLAMRLDARFGLVALDEGQEPDEAPPSALIERLAFHLDLSGLGWRDVLDDGPDADAVSRARHALAALPAAGDPIIEALCHTAQLIGVDSARATLLALRVARAHAALAGRPRIAEEDAAVAARLVLGPRATLAPAEADPEEAIVEPGEPPPPSEEPPGPPNEPDADQIIAAIQAALPDDLFERLKLDGGPRAAPARARGAGAKAKAARRGRPIGSRAGGWRAGDRLNLVETLRAATPWRRLRVSAGDDGRVQVRKEDFRVRRFVQRRESTTIFVVDASGSSAFQRLAEAKGAVELLLAKAYVSRTRVALIAFRGREAELLLPPTRSLTRAKRRLADLPGGGGTPLASGLEVALRLALAERSGERTPLLVLLTDGRANIGRGGEPGRAAAMEDALAAARLVRASGVASAYIDTSPRPRADGDQLARAMGAVYAPLPYVDAGAVFAVVDEIRGAGVGRSAR